MAGEGTENSVEFGAQRFRLNSEGDQTPVRPFPWQLRSSKEYYELNDDLQNRFGIRLIWRARDCKGRSKAMDEWHCYPVGRGRADKQDREGNPYTVLGSLPPSKTMCSVCWNEGHWKNQCKVRELVYELWEPALTVLQPKEKLRKLFPMRNIVIDKNKDEKDQHSRYFPAISFVDYGAISSQIRDANKKFAEAKRKHPDMFPEIEPPAEEQGERSVPYAVSKKMAKPDPVSEDKPEQDATMETRKSALMDMQGSAKQRRSKVLDQAKSSEVVNLEDDSQNAESKKSSGKGKQNIWTEAPSLPPGH